MAKPVFNQTVHEAAFAKINLGLAVLNRRPDGYHDIETVFQAISLFEDVTVRMQPSTERAVELACDREDLANESNLAWRAADALLSRIGLRARVRVEIRKTLPVGAGLGGGSSDAAAVLRAINAMRFNAIPHAVLHGIASELGSDVPYFLMGGRAVASGRGTELRAVPDLPKAAVVLVLPGIEVSTAWAYRALARARAAGELTAVPVRRKIGVLGRAADWFEGGSLGGPIKRLENDFEAVVFQRFPAIRECKAKLLACGARHALLSGSGSTVFGVFDSDEAASGTCAKLAAEGLRVERAQFISSADAGIELDSRTDASPSQL